MFCNNCGKKILKESKFCPYCGTKIKKNYQLRSKIKWEKIKFYLFLSLLFLLILLISSFLLIKLNKRVPSTTVTNKETVADETKIPINPGIHRYEFINSFESFNNAVNDARSKGGYLLHIDTLEEYNLINNKLEELYQNGSETMEYYIGGKRFADSGYKWIDQNGNVYGDNINNINFWYPGEPSFIDPNNKDVEESVLCIIRGSSDWLVNDVVDDVDALYDEFKGKLGYIIEYE